MQTELFSLVEYRPRPNGEWAQYKTHIFNKPYGICKARKNGLESESTVVKRFFKIVKPN
jgi:hypothetical protein